MDRAAFTRAATSLEVLFIGEMVRRLIHTSCLRVLAC